jgi:site-specific DNA-methyltransferase (adenine-specific)
MPMRQLTHVPDILDTLAQLSNDEVPTPPSLARDMLDELPDKVWAEWDYRWLDPFCKSGAFLREIGVRLLEGLSDKEPDFQKRRQHVYREMLWGTSVTAMTAMITRRSVYYSRDASGEQSVVRFDHEEGNLPFVAAKHEFNTGDADGAHVRCKICGAPEKLERGAQRENYAYSFIHGAYPTKEMEDMKFDVIVGNPPFQIGDGGGGGKASATPLYNLFVEKAKEMEPRHIVMITPSRWFSGGKGLDDFRDRMLKDRHFVSLVDHPRLYDCFPGVKIRGGVSYFHWCRDHDGPCAVTTRIGDEAIGPPVSRFLDSYDVLIRRNEAVEILDKVTSYRIDGEPEKSLADHVSSRKPFGLESKFRGQESKVGLSEPVLVYGTQHKSWTEREMIPANKDWIDDWKVLLVKAHGTSGREDLTILGEPIVAGPGEACSETYLVVGRFDTEEEAKNLAAYTRTRFLRFLVSLRKITQNITKDSYRFVPVLPINRAWTDEDLYARYGLSAEDVEFIESVIKERPDADADVVVDPDELEELD